jgi:hypothetical protein
MADTVTAALVGAAVALFGIFLRDLVFPFFMKVRDEQRSVETIFRSYSDPIASSAQSLFWRLNEVFGEAGRGAYLAVDEDATEYVEYKRISTIYRFLSLLAWVQAYRRELAMLRPVREKDLGALKNALSDLETALATGDHIEAERLDSLINLWGMRANVGSAEKERIGILLEQSLNKHLKRAEKPLASELRDTEKKRLCKDLSTLIANELKVSTPSNEAVEKTLESAIQYVSYREAWIYRDWQAALGDLLLMKMDTGPRGYDVIGYKKFEEMYFDSDGESERWIERAKCVFDDLDVSGTNRFDARYNQLRQTRKATASLIVAICDADSHQKHALKDTYARSKEVLRESA